MVPMHILEGCNELIRGGILCGTYERWIEDSQKLERKRLTEVAIADI
jgi:hypothetical protein